jgi:hypothetical protein
MTTLENQAFLAPKFEFQVLQCCHFFSPPNDCVEDDGALVGSFRSHLDVPCTNRPLARGANLMASVRPFRAVNKPRQERATVVRLASTSRTVELLTTCRLQERASNAIALQGISERKPSSPPMSASILRPGALGPALLDAAAHFTTLQVP